MPQALQAKLGQLQVERDAMASQLAQQYPTKAAAARASSGKPTAVPTALAGKENLLHSLAET